MIEGEGHHRKPVLIKIGGSLLDMPGAVLSVARQIGKIRAHGIAVSIVHGAGPSISRRMREEGLEPKFVAGRRVTDRRTLEIACAALDEVNSALVDALRETGIAAVGYSSRSPLFLCHKAADVEEEGEPLDLGFVGKISRVRNFVAVSPAPVRVVAPVGQDFKGVRYNINADDAATALCAALGCEAIFFASDVPGILRSLDDQSSLIASLTLDELDELINGGIIGGGMIPKLEGARSALACGARLACIFDGSPPEALVSAVLAPGSRGSILYPAHLS